MAEPKWTPGPWRAHGWNDLSNVVPIYGLGCWVASAQYLGGTELAKINARLIAAAPDLAEALHSTLTLLKAFVTREDDIARAVLEQAEAALAKARGEQP